MKEDKEQRKGDGREEEEGSTHVLTLPHTSGVLFSDRSASARNLNFSKTPL
jgi:hypothetical protein